MLDNAEALLSGPSHGGDAGTQEEAYHYHTKMMIKEPHVGGAWEWHQDYGYWYGNGNMEGSSQAVDWLLVAATAITVVVTAAAAWLSCSK